MTIAELFTQKGFSKGVEQGLSQGIEKGLSQGIEKGKLEGKSEAAHEIACKMLSEKLPFATVERVTGLSYNELHKLSQSIH